jgi:protein SCO1
MNTTNDFHNAVSGSVTADSGPDSNKRAWLRSIGRGALLPLGLAVGATPSLHAAPSPGANYFPNFVVQTHDGRRLRFYDDVVRGKVVVVNMMYTVCTGICPGNTANLREVQKELGSRLGKEVFMVSMTLQPELDTPQALRDYVESYDIQPGWTFLTGKPKEVELIRRKLGFFNTDPSVDSDISSHTGMIRIGNDRLNRWSMMPALARPTQIARTILQA